MTGVEFYLGGPGTGAPLHYHQDAFNVLVYGTKRWHLRPPFYASLSNEPAYTFFKGLHDQYTKKTPEFYLECIQQPGDIVFVPYGWAHAVLNIQESVGFAVEMQARDIRKQADIKYQI